MFQRNHVRNVHFYVRCAALQDRQAVGSNLLVTQMRSKQEKQSTEYKVSLFDAHIGNLYVIYMEAVLFRNFGRNKFVG